MALTYELDQSRIVIGRGSSAEVRLPHTAISARHAVLEARGSTYVLIDEGSTNGTSVNGARLPPSRPKVLRDGDRIALPAAGLFELTVQLGAPIASPTSSEQTATLARRLVREVLGTIEERCAPAALRFMSGPRTGERIELGEGRRLIGRDPSCDVAIDDDAEVSREHAELVCDAGSVSIAPLAPKNEVLVGGEVLAAPRRLRHGDELLIGGTTLSFEDPAEVAIDAVARAPGDDPLEARAPAPVVAPEVEPPPPEPEPPVAISRKQGRSGADLVIYGLALLVLGLSIAGLVWLFLP